jgi:hypothetical protein
MEVSLTTFSNTTVQAMKLKGTMFMENRNKDGTIFLLPTPSIRCVCKFSVQPTVIFNFNKTVEMS